MSIYAVPGLKTARIYQVFLVLSLLQGLWPVNCVFVHWNKQEHAVLLGNALTGPSSQIFCLHFFLPHVVGHSLKPWTGWEKVWFGVWNMFFFAVKVFFYLVTGEFCKSKTMFLGFVWLAKLAIFTHGELIENRSEMRSKTVQHVRGGCLNHMCLFFLNLGS